MRKNVTGGERSAIRVLAVGDSYLPVTVIRDVLRKVASHHDIAYLQLDEHEPLVPRTESERRIREFTGRPEQIAEHLDGVEVLVVHGAPVTEEVLAAGPDVRLVCCMRGGPVNVDPEALSRRRVPLVTTPGKNADSVADQTIAFLVMLARRFRKACAFLLEGGRTGQSAFEGVEFFGNDLGDHVLGLVGFGQVGSRVARRAKPFGMRVAVFDPGVTIGAEHGVEQVGNLDELLARSDFVSLHARETKGGKPLFGTREFAHMKRGAFLVNTARESLVDEAALDAALASGHLAGAALDVLQPRTEPGPHPLLRHENVVLTPHIGGATHETLVRGVTMVAEEIARFSAGDPLRYATLPEPTPSS